MGALYRIVNDEPPRPRDAGWLAPVLERTMAKDPADRWSMAEVRDQLLRRDTDETPTRRVPVAPPAVPVADPPTAVGPPTAAAPTAAAPTSTVAPTTAAASQVSSLREARPASDRGRGRRLPSAVLWGLLALVVAGVIGGAWLLAGRGTDDGSSGATAGGGQTASPDPSQSSSPSSSPSRTPTPSTTPSPSPSPSETSDALPPATEDSMKDFVRDYLATVTEDPETAWTRLTPAYQRASGGLSGYTGFWSTIAEANPKSIDADPDALTVAYDVEYERTDGSKVEEAVTLLLRRTEDGYLIAGQRA
jgi:hypothetical protein